MMRPEPRKSGTFYGELSAWSIKTVAVWPDAIPLINAGSEARFAGIMEFKKPAFPRNWVSYHHRRRRRRGRRNAAKSNGGTIANGRNRDLPDVGRLRRAADPFRRRPAGRSRARTPKRRTRRTGTPEPSEFCWGTLRKSDSAKSDCILHESLPWTSKRPRPPGQHGISYAGDSNDRDSRRRRRAFRRTGSRTSVVAKLAEARWRAKRSAAKASWDEIVVPGGCVRRIQGQTSGRPRSGLSKAGWKLRSSGPATLRPVLRMASSPSGGMRASTRPPLGARGFSCAVAIKGRLLR